MTPRRVTSSRIGLDHLSWYGHDIPLCGKTAHRLTARVKPPASSHATRAVAALYPDRKGADAPEHLQLRREGLASTLLPVTTSWNFSNSPCAPSETVFPLIAGSSSTHSPWRGAPWPWNAASVITSTSTGARYRNRSRRADAGIRRDWWPHRASGSFGGPGCGPGHALVELVQLAHPRKNLLRLLKPAVSASTSSRVLYAPKRRPERCGKPRIAASGAGRSGGRPGPRCRECPARCRHRGDGSRPA